MIEYIKNLPQEIQDLIKFAGNLADSNNVSAYLVGGFVRDLILGVNNLDLDIVVENDGIKFAEFLSESLNAKLTRHRRFGTATVLVKPHLKLDVATARKEFYPHPAHLPVVSGGSLKDDLFRRDFTINAMAIGLNSGNFGQLIDYFGGQVDLKNMKLRVLHDLSFIDDPTRILRAIRFETRHDFKIEPHTFKLLKSAVRLKMLNKVEPQRLRDDLVLILKERKPIKEIKRLKVLAGFNFISQHLEVTLKTLKLFASVEKEIAWFKKIHLKKRQLEDWLIYLMALLDSLDAKKVGYFCRRFAFKKGEEKRILSEKNIDARFVSKLKQKDFKPSEIFKLLDPLSYEAIILLKAKHRNRLTKKRIEDFFEIYNEMKICVSGKDLHALGVAPGPFYKKIFTKVLNAKLNGVVKTREEELELIKNSIKAQ